MFAQGQKLGKSFIRFLITLCSSFPMASTVSGQLGLKGMPAVSHVPIQGPLSFLWPDPAGNPRSRSTLAKYILDQAQL